MYSIFDSEILLDSWFRKEAVISNPQGEVMEGLSQGSGGIVSGTVIPSQQQVNPNTVSSGEMGSILAYAKKNFTDTTEGWIQGLDTDGVYKWLIGSLVSSIDWAVTTPSTLTIVGNVISTSGSIGGWTINSTSITGTGVTLSSAGDAYLAFGTTPPISPTVGTGIFINKTGLFGLSANTQNFKIDATNGNITSIAGSIGAWNITPTVLRSGATDAASNILLDPTTSILRLGPTTGNYLTLDGANLRIRSSNYVSGFAGGGVTLEPDLLEVGNIACRGLLRTYVLQKDILSVNAGSLLITPNADVLDTDMTAAD